MYSRALLLIDLSFESLYVNDSSIEAKNYLSSAILIFKTLNPPLQTVKNLYCSQFVHEMMKHTEYTRLMVALQMPLNTDVTCMLMQYKMWLVPHHFGDSLCFYSIRNFSLSEFGFNHYLLVRTFDPPPELLSVLVYSHDGKFANLRETLFIVHYGKWIKVTHCLWWGQRCVEKVNKPSI